MIRPSPRSFAGAAIATLALAGCQTTAGGDVTRASDPGLIPTITAPAQPEGKDGACWGQVPGPSVTTLVAQTVVAEEAVFDADGTEISPAIYRNVTVPKTVSTGEGSWFERVCDTELTSDLVMNLQRALGARTYYGGPASGELDAATRASIRLYQQEQGLDSDVLSLATARQLGLITVDLPPTEDEALGTAIDLEVEAVLQDGLDSAGNAG